MSRHPDLIVFSHLRWNFVWQRPQQLLTRLAEKRRVWFIEEPIETSDKEPSWDFETVGDGKYDVIVARPRTPLLGNPGFHSSQFDYLRPLLRTLVEQHQLRQYDVWFYTPMAVSLLEVLQPRTIVYDCMDELSAFRHAPPEMLRNEATLLEKADLAFTGGPSLYEAKKDRHPHVHCFPSSVDLAHFGKAASGLASHPDQEHVPHPRLGFFGVIDERLDIPLLDFVATARPDWQLMLVGPVVKIDPELLPRHANIHYLGQRSYEELPSFVSGWDVCLLPFALNEATRFISPTKTLEYMAARKQIVSTPIRDVEEPYSGLVEIARTPEQFVQAIDRLLNADNDELQSRLDRMEEVLARTSWHETAEAMQQLMDDAPSAPPSSDRAQRVRVDEASDAKPNATLGGSLSDHRADDTHVHRNDNGQAPVIQEPLAPSADLTPPVVIIGAGPTGLSAAYHLGENALLLEQNTEVGGWCRSIEVDGFTFDFAGHIMFSNDPYVHEMYQLLLGDNVHWQDREAWVYSKNVYTRYPFQGALYGLPPEVIKECLMGAIEVRLGTSQESNRSSDDSTSSSGRPNGQGTNGHSSNGERSVDRRVSPVRLSATSPTKESNGLRGTSLRRPELSRVDMTRTNSTRELEKGRADARRPDTAKGASLRHDALRKDIAAKGPIVCSNDSVDDCCGDGVLESTAPLKPIESSNGKNALTSTPAGPRNFEEFIYQVWGRGIAKHFAIPYNRKLWAVPLTEMETSWLGGRVPLPDLEQMIDGALQPVPKPMGPNARFGYPLRGGFQALMNGFLPHLKRPPMLGARVKTISPSRHEVTLHDGTIIPYEQLISTMPLPVLIRSMQAEAPEEVRRAAAALRYTSVRCVHLGIGREALTEKHWIYYPEDTIFHRIFVQGNASPHCNAPGGFALTCEITYHDTYKPLPCTGAELIARCVDDCRKVGIIGPDDRIVSSTDVDMPHAYVIYDHARVQHVAIIREWLAKHGITLAGRYSEWEYYNSDHAFLAGKHAAESVIAQRNNRSSAASGRLASKVG